MTNRTPLISDTLGETTYTARKAGAIILGRALAHLEDQDGPIVPGSEFCPWAFARKLGYDLLCADIAMTHYNELLGIGL